MIVPEALLADDAGDLTDDEIIAAFVAVGLTEAYAQAYLVARAGNTPTLL